MAFLLYVSVNNSITNLSDGAPYSTESLVDAGGAPVVRYTQRGILRVPTRDLGFRFATRDLMLNLLFYASSDAELDGYRDDLMNLLKPLTGIPLLLRMQRDDGEIRQLSCYANGEIDISLLPENRPGHLHRASIPLRAHEPLWSSLTTSSANWAGTTSLHWWRAGEAIGSANVMEHVDNPSQGQAWTYTGTITGEWSIAFRSGTVAHSGTPVAYHAGTGVIIEPDAVSGVDAKFYWGSTGIGGVTGWRLSTNTLTPGSALQPGTTNYITYHNTNALEIGLNQSLNAYDGTVGFLDGQLNYDYNIAGTTRRWRSDRNGSASSYWPTEMPKAAVYDI